ncbi:MAG: tetratricopeptide repeat protein [Bryobacteraceae bacterium]
MPPKKSNKKRAQASSNKPAPPPPPPPKHIQWLKIVVPVLGLLGVGVVSFVLWRIYFVHQKTLQKASTATYVGKEKCAECHAAEVQSWLNSHHAQAMQVTNDSTVLGDFKNANFTKDGVTSTFSTKEGKYYVRSDGPDGKLHDYELPYTFGVYPLQQYLAPFPRGRYQSFVLAWDSHTAALGGQRWYHLYADQKMPSTDPLHWTGRNQTWNYMCADCHSTNLKKNYDLAKDSYHTTWSEINVSCETCHGPGSKHVAWGQEHKKKSSYQPGEGATGLTVILRRPVGMWAAIEPFKGTMHWKGQPRTRDEVNTCAPCHSRRHPITQDIQPGQPYSDAYVPSLLEEGVYFADGQIQEEDYEYGSFLQSKMYEQGVSCGDCHDSHSAKLAQTNLNAVCGKCHSLAKFAGEEHTHHKVTGTGGVCVNCHMTTRTYMGVDARRDHSFRVPRPDYSVAYGTPNACNQCHKDKSNAWSVEAVVKWYGPNRRHEPHFVEAIEAGRRGSVDGEGALAALIRDTKKPGIARATALTLLPEYLTEQSIPAVQAATEDADPLVRSQSITAMEPLSPKARVKLAGSLLSDPVRAVRIEAARLLAGTQPDLLQEDQKAALERGISELIASEMVSAERPENHMNLALLYMKLNKSTEAEAELMTALRLDPNFVPAMVNLADFYRMQQRDAEGEKWLRQAMAAAPDASEPVHVLGLLKARQGQKKEALELFAKASEMAPTNVRFNYVYAVALNSGGQPDEAITVLQKAHDQRPADREVLYGLVTFERDKGHLKEAIVYAKQLVELTRGDENSKKLLAELMAKNR